MIARDERTPEQTAVVDEIRSGPRGVFGGPFIPLLRTPALLGHLEKVGENLRFNSSASRHLSEFVVLLTALGLSAMDGTLAAMGYVHSRKPGVAPGRRDGQLARKAVAIPASAAAREWSW